MIKPIQPLISKFRRMLRHAASVPPSISIRPGDAEEMVCRTLVSVINAAEDFQQNHYTPWISVKDKPFPRDEKIDVFTLESRRITDMHYNPVSNRLVGINPGCSPKEVTHWMYQICPSNAIG